MGEGLPALPDRGRVLSRLQHAEAGPDGHPAPPPDQALGQRNDTLWDLVVHLRDYVEQLRAERHALREEAQQLRVALAEVSAEVRALRAGQGAANSNEMSAGAAEQPPSEPTRLGIPKRLH